MRPLPLLIVVLVIAQIVSDRVGNGLQILSKSKLETCEKVSDSNSPLNCSSKIVIDLAVPSGSSGRESSIVAEIVEVEENSTSNMRALRIPPVVTVNKSAAYALYELTYIRDVPYRPEELYVKTRKCEPDAGADVVQICERLRDEKGNIIDHTQPICCPCGDQRRVPSSCGNFFDKMVKGKANTAHCLRFPGDWFHVFGVGQRSVGFSIQIKVKTESKISEVVVGPEKRTAVSNDNFLRVNLVGDYVGYTDIPSFDNFYLVIPRQGSPGQPQILGRNFSTWMLLERVRFTLDGLECNKIGVSFEAFNGQPDFCSAPFWSCLHNQLWNFWEADQNRIRRKQVPLYGVQGRFERINEHPNPGSHSFSIGITEVLNTNLLIELRADDIEYVYQRSPGKILSITIPTFEALTQFGIATITTKNIGEVEASYSLTFDCSTGVSQMEEQYYIMKSGEVVTRSFKLYPTTDQAAKYVCAAILKDSSFSEVDRAECQFTTTATVLDNGSQIKRLMSTGKILSPPGAPSFFYLFNFMSIQIPFQPPKNSINGFFESIEEFLNKLWAGLVDFITGKTCRTKCSGFLDFHCHIQYICMSWMVIFGLVLAIFPIVVVLLWLLHQKGLFDPLYDWWEDHIWIDELKIRHSRKQRLGAELSQIYIKKHHKKETGHHKHDAHKRREIIHHEHRVRHLERDTDYQYYLHHVNKNKHKHRRVKGSIIKHQLYVDNKEDDCVGHRRGRKERESVKELHKIPGYSDAIQEEHYKLNSAVGDARHNKLHVKRREE